MFTALVGPPSQLDDLSRSMRTYVDQLFEYCDVAVGLKVLGTLTKYVPAASFESVCFAAGSFYRVVVSLCFVVLIDGDLGRAKKLVLLKFRRRRKENRRFGCGAHSLLETGPSMVIAC